MVHRGIRLDSHDPATRLTGESASMIADWQGAAEFDAIGVVPWRIDTPTPLPTDLLNRVKIRIADFDRVMGHHR